MDGDSGDPPSLPSAPAFSLVLPEALSAPFDDVNDSGNPDSFPVFTVVVTGKRAGRSAVCVHANEYEDLEDNGMGGVSFTSPYLATGETHSFHFSCSLSTANWWRGRKRKKGGQQWRPATLQISGEYNERHSSGSIFKSEILEVLAGVAGGRVITSGR